ncbi:signal peptidase I [Priestia flexa]|uniref:Signal peptidase I n=2 Tax=Priestia TaxID=2800373 RepID=A0A0V8JME2_9BACI|nr:MULTISPECIES: signal peptidase I [Bacillaceae]AQX55483.1 signal peptidase I [Priestia flexa]KSU88136.1 S26 family signal peptidase [Priestia veravalensis]KZB90848.1 signal peptidase I [Bacillus sp. VT 712]MBN8252607.1 signal peptidase I [Priestia flexa]MBN8434078.1 signal peptidase I [Priestia flexa]
MRKTRIKREIIIYCSIILGTLLFSLIVQQYFFQPYTVKGDSMNPTLQEGNRIIINKLSNYQRFDLVVLHSPHDQDEYLVKRIIGVAGEKIEYIDDQLYINNQKVSEPHLHKYLQHIPTYERFTENFSTEELVNDGIIPHGFVLVLGDNRRISRDGRHFGLTPVSDIVGEVDVKYWPLTDLKLMH